MLLTDLEKVEKVTLVVVAGGSAAGFPPRKGGQGVASASQSPGWVTGVFLAAIGRTLTE